MDYSFGVDLIPMSFPPPGRLKPAFQGLSPGSVGLYQINVTLPEVASGVESCSLPGTVGPGGAFVSSNLTLMIKGGASSDSVGICVRK
jgi:uncharacterized protein (TIGR03437 family)